MYKLKTKIIDISSPSHNIEQILARIVFSLALKCNPCFLRCFCTILPLSIYFVFATFIKRVDFFC